MIKLEPLGWKTRRLTWRFGKLHCLTGYKTLRCNLVSVCQTLDNANYSCSLRTIDWLSHLGIESTAPESRHVIWPNLTRHAKRRCGWRDREIIWMMKQFVTWRHMCSKYSFGITRFLIIVLPSCNQYECGVCNESFKRFWLNSIFFPYRCQALVYEDCKNHKVNSNAGLNCPNFKWLG